MIRVIMAAQPGLEHCSDQPATSLDYWRDCAAFNLTVLRSEGYPSRPIMDSYAILQDLSRVLAAARRIC